MPLRNSSEVTLYNTFLGLWKRLEECCLMKDGAQYIGRSVSNFRRNLLFTPLDKNYVTDIQQSLTLQVAEPFWKTWLVTVSIYIKLLRFSVGDIWPN
jgi:hypothetical protein